MDVEAIKTNKNAVVFLQLVQKLAPLEALPADQAKALASIEAVFTDIFNYLFIDAPNLTGLDKLNFLLKPLRTNRFAQDATSLYLDTSLLGLPEAVADKTNLPLADIRQAYQPSKNILLHLLLTATLSLMTLEEDSEIVDLKAQLLEAFRLFEANMQSTVLNDTSTALLASVFRALVEAEAFDTAENIFALNPVAYGAQMATLKSHLTTVPGLEPGSSEKQYFQIAPIVTRPADSTYTHKVWMLLEDLTVLSQTDDGKRADFVMDLLKTPAYQNMVAKALVNEQSLRNLQAFLGLLDSIAEHSSDAQKQQIADLIPGEAMALAFDAEKQRLIAEAKTDTPTVSMMSKESQEDGSGGSTDKEDLSLVATSLTEMASIAETASDAGSIKPTLKGSQILEEVSAYETEAFSLNDGGEELMSEYGWKYKELTNRTQDLDNAPTLTDTLVELVERDDALTWEKLGARLRDIERGQPVAKLKGWGSRARVAMLDMSRQAQAVTIKTKETVSAVRNLSVITSKAVKSPELSHAQERLGMVLTLLLKQPYCYDNQTMTVGVHPLAKALQPLTQLIYDFLVKPAVETGTTSQQAQYCVQDETGEQRESCKEFLLECFSAEPKEVLQQNIVETGVPEGAVFRYLLRNTSNNSGLALFGSTYSNLFSDFSRLYRKTEEKITGQHDDTPAATMSAELKAKLEEAQEQAASELTLASAISASNSADPKIQAAGDLLAAMQDSGDESEEDEEKEKKERPTLTK